MNNLNTMEKENLQSHLQKKKQKWKKEMKEIIIFCEKLFNFPSETFFCYQIIINFYALEDIL